jgi:hypothetical protein
MMDRPKCQGCIYWERLPSLDQMPSPEDLAEMSPEEIAEGEAHYSRMRGNCHRYPPEMDWEGDGTTIETHGGGTQYNVSSNMDWCGEHPDFPAYLASVRAKNDGKLGPA